MAILQEVFRLAVLMFTSHVSRLMSTSGKQSRLLFPSFHRRRNGVAIARFDMRHGT